MTDEYIEVDEQEQEQGQEQRPAATREAAYEYLRNNPQELEAIAKVYSRSMSSPQPEAGIPPRPNPDDYETYEEYFAARDAYEEMMIEHRIEERVRQIEAKYSPVVTAQAAKIAAQSIAERHRVPSEAMPFIEQTLSALSPDQLASLDNDAQQLIALAAKGFAVEKGAVPRSEPVAGVTSRRYQLADGVTQSEIDAYLSITGRKLDRDTVAQLKREGYLK